MKLYEMATILAGTPLYIAFIWGIAVLIRRRKEPTFGDSDERFAMSRNGD